VETLWLPLSADEPTPSSQHALTLLLAHFAGTFSVRSPVRLLVGTGGRTEEEAAGLVLSAAAAAGLDLEQTAEVFAEAHRPPGPRVTDLLPVLDARADVDAAVQLIRECARRIAPITVLTPVRDRVDWAQEFQPTPGLHHLVVDNASSDGTPDVLEASGLEVARFQAPVDRVGSWRRAVQHFASASPSPWFKWLFAGDQLLPEAADILLQAVEDAPDVGLVVAEYLIDSGDGHTHHWRMLPETTVLQPAQSLELSARQGNWFGSPVAHLFSRRAIEHLDFGAEPWVADWQACLSVAQHLPVLYLAEVVGVFDVASRHHYAVQESSLHARVQEAEVRLRSAETLATMGVDVRQDVHRDVTLSLSERLPLMQANTAATAEMVMGPLPGPRLAIHQPRRGGDPRDIHGYVPLFCEAATFAYLPVLATQPQRASEFGVQDDRFETNTGALEVVTSPAELQRKADVLVGFEGRPYLPHLAPPVEFTGLKAYHVMDFVFHASAAADRLRSGQTDLLLGYARHDVHSPFFAHVYRGFEGRVLPVPFGASPRYRSSTSWSARRPVAVGLGAVNPVDDPLCDPGELTDYVEFYQGTRWTHAWRRELSERRASLVDVLDARFPEWPDTKDATPDAASLLADVQFFVNDPGLMAFPPARSYEGMAAGSVMVAGAHPVWGELGLHHGVNALFHRPGDVDAFRQTIRAAAAEPTRTAVIAAAGAALVEAEYRFATIAQKLRSELLSRLTSR